MSDLRRAYMSDLLQQIQQANSPISWKDLGKATKSTLDQPSRQWWNNTTKTPTGRLRRPGLTSISTVSLKPSIKTLVSIGDNELLTKLCDRLLQATSVSLQHDLMLARLLCSPCRNVLGIPGGQALSRRGAAHPMVQ